MKGQHLDIPEKNPDQNGCVHVRFVDITNTGFQFPASSSLFVIDNSRCILSDINVKTNIILPVYAAFLIIPAIFYSVQMRDCYHAKQNRAVHGSGFSVYQYTTVVGSS